MSDVPQKVMVLRSAPGTPEAVSTLTLAVGLRAQGQMVAIVLVQDAVLASIGASHLESASRLRGLLEGGATCYYLDEDLAMRGYGPTDVLPGCRAVSYSELVEVLLADGVSVAGAF